MKIQKTKIENFMAIGSAEIVLADRGLVLIQGENKDDTSAKSNGAGKSSIADAICWCLYGTTARGESGDAIVNDVAGKNCLVEVQVEDGDNLYTITRHRKHSKGKNTLKVWQFTKGVRSPGTDLTKGTEKLTQEVVNQIIGCSQDVFCGAVYAGQERMPDLPGMTDKHLKMLIEEASGATILEAAYNEANKRLSAKKFDLISFQSQTQRAADAVVTAQDVLNTAVANRDGFAANQVRRAGDLVTHAKAVKLEIANAEALIAGHRPRSTIEDEIKAIDDKLASVSSEAEELRKLNEAVAKAEKLGVIAEANCRSAATAFKAAQNALLALDHQVGCPCKTCARPYSAEDIAPAKELAEEALKSAESDAHKHGEVFKAQEKRVAAAIKERDDYLTIMTDVTALLPKRKVLEDELRKCDVLAANLKTLQDRYESLIDQVKAIKTEINPHFAQIEQAQEALEAAQEHAASLGALVKTAEEDVKSHEIAAKVFSPAGVRAFLLDEVTPFLNEQTAKYLGTLSDGNIQATWTTLIKNAKGELREKFSIEVSNAVGGKSFGLVSGGEKRKVRIACALALQDLVARRASKPIELFIGDEIDDALDSAGLERLTAILEEKARERGSVFIISHNDLKDWVTNAITVKKVGGQSVVEEVTA